ncbi:hypothetical protein C1H76_1675 [Elsinoe australis]|uniref:Uncharacterized protein n=1 Tax=Elsinoe australis TaxID=40998 RepID=A0A4U7B532_9PEZI|nr:hypothetical protein C1H76_1675 [Elsinoe australis]
MSAVILGPVLELDASPILKPDASFVLFEAPDDDALGSILYLNVNHNPLSDDISSAIIPSNDSEKITLDHVLNDALVKDILDPARAARKPSLDAMPEYDTLDEALDSALDHVCPPHLVVMNDVRAGAGYTSRESFIHQLDRR